MGNKLVRARQYPWGVVQGECWASTSPTGPWPSLFLSCKLRPLSCHPSAHLHGHLAPQSSLRHPATLVLHAYLMQWSHEAPNIVCCTPNHLPVCSVEGPRPPVLPSHTYLHTYLLMLWSHQGTRLLPCCPLPGPHMPVCMTVSCLLHPCF